MASGGLGALTVDLLLETAQWLAGLNKAEYQAKQFADAIEAKFSKMAGVAVESLKGLAAGVVAGFSAKAMVDFVASATQAADKLSDISAKTGATVASLAQLSTYAGMAGTSIDAVGNSIVKFNKALVENSGKTQELLAALNIQTAGKQSQEVLQEVADAIAAIEDPAQRSTAAIALFGKAGAEMVPMLLAMAGASKELRAANVEHGEVMSRLAEQYDKLEAAQAVAETRSRTFAALLAEQFVPYTTKLYESINALTDSSGKLGDGMQAVVNAFKGLLFVVDLVVTAFIDLGILVVGLVRAFVAFAAGRPQDALNALKDAFTDVDKQGKLFGARMTALLDPIQQQAAAAKKAAEENERLAKALGKGGGAAGAAEQMAAEQKILEEQSALTIKYFKEEEERRKKAADLRAKRLKDATEAELAAQKIIAEAQEFAVKFEVNEARKAAKEKEEILKGITKAAEEEAKIQREQSELTAKFQIAQGKLAADELKNEWAEVTAAMEDMGRNAFDSLFSDTGGGWRDMLGGMARDFKKMLVDFVYKQFAKPLILNLMAMMPGGMGQYASGLMGQGGGLGGGSGGIDWMSVGTKAYDYFFGAGETASGFMGPTAAELGAEQAAGTMWTTASGAPTSMAMAGYGAAGGLFGYGAATLYGAGDRGVANATSYGAAGATAGAYIGSIIPVVGTLVGAAVGAIIGTIVGISTDPDPDAMRQATFGAAAGAEGLTAYKYTSALGEFGISDTKWFSDEEMGPALKEFIAGMQNLDNAIASTLSTEELDKVRARLASASKEYDFGMEHGAVGGAAEIVKDRLRIITEEVAPELMAFFDSFAGGVEDLSTVISGYLSLRNVADFNAGDIVEQIYAENEAKASQMELYARGTQELNELVAAWDGSAASTTAVTQSLQMFQEATIAMMFAIDAAAESMHAMFMDTAEAIRQSTMSEEERYAYLQERSAGLFDQLLTETDPAKIQQLGEQINADINAAWGMLSDEQKQSLSQSFLERLDALDTAVATKMAGLRDVVEEGSDSMMGNIKDKLDEIFMKGSAAAQTQLDAANAQVEAANTPVQVVVSVVSDTLVSEAG